MSVHVYAAARRRARRWGGAALTLVAAGALMAPSPPAGAASVPSRVVLPSPDPTNLSGTSKPLDPAQVLNLRVYLADRPGVAAAATGVSDPDSPQYGHFLTPAQFQRTFGPTADQVAAVRDWLTGQGITITATTDHYLGITTTAATFDTAFATRVDEYDSPAPIGSSTFRQVGVTGDLTVPAELGPDILSITGFDETALPRTTGSPNDSPTVPAARTTRTASATDIPCSHYWAEHTTPIPEAFGQTTAPTPICGYTPQQMRHAYGLDTSPQSGKGATVAVVLDDRNPDMPADADRFFADHDLPGFAPGQYVEDDVSPPSSSHCTSDSAAAASHSNAPGGLAGQWIESAIDIEAVHLAAPDAKLVYVGMDCTTFSGAGSDYFRHGLDAVTKVVDERLADVATGSWARGEQTYGPADLLPWDEILEQGALEGIGFDFSAGDSGNTLSGKPVYVAFPADDPWSTDVGGTSLALGADGSVIGDYPWGRHVTQPNADGTGYQPAPPGDFDGGTGGGVSPYYPQPDYQKPVVPTELSTLDGSQRPGRAGPDIALDAGIPTLIGYTGALVEGQYDEAAQGSGTSLSSPLLAGMEADVIQAVGHPLGFVNPLLYRARATGAYRDILPVDPAHPPIEYGFESPAQTDPMLFTEGEDGVLQATAGYDDATGLGAPSTTFIADLSAVCPARRR